ncbi:MAG: hypothetical protein U1E87_05895, partial [Alphaproteobacteria bacterium]
LMVSHELVEWSNHEGRFVSPAPLRAQVLQVRKEVGTSVRLYKGPRPRIFRLRTYPRFCRGREIEG